MDTDAALASYDILDTPAEPAFDELAHLAARLFAAPSAAINFVALVYAIRLLWLLTGRTSRGKVRS